MNTSKNLIKLNDQLDQIISAFEKYFNEQHSKLTNENGLRVSTN